MLSSRVWFYLGFSILFSGMVVFGLGTTHRVAIDQQNLKNTISVQLRDQLAAYAAKQTNERKLITLSKHLSNYEPTIIQPLIERAYAINPNTRDTVLLESAYHPELKRRVIPFDPIFTY